MTDTTNIPNQTGDWFYTLAGQRNGPVTTDSIKQLLDTQKIDGSTPLWRTGLADWKPLRETELGALVQNAPPPITSNLIGNGFVWALAIVPIPYAFIYAAIALEQAQSIDGEWYLSIVNWVIPFVINSALCLIDENQLKRAGYNADSLTAFAVFLAPIYLFKRAKMLGQKPTYGYVWIATFLLSIMMNS